MNVLTQDTTYMGMFTPDGYYLFGREELAERFSGWSVDLNQFDNFPAPGGTVIEGLRAGLGEWPATAGVAVGDLPVVGS